MGEFKVDGDATVINSLVNSPKVPLTPTIVPIRQTSIYVSHRVHIKAGVFDELIPFGGVTDMIGSPQLHVFWAWLGEQVYQLLARLVFSFVGRHAEDVAQRAQRAGEAVGERLHHRVAYLLNGYVDASMAQDCAVEVAVVDDDAVGEVNHRLKSLWPVTSAMCAIPDLHRRIVYRKRHKQHLRLFGIAVRAVRDRHGAVCFEVKPESAHEAPD